jgi:hypothetical protein
MTLTDQDLDNLLAILAERERLKALTNRALVLEVLGHPAADDPVVIELMNRVLPGWEHGFTEEETES